MSLTERIKEREPSKLVPLRMSEKVIPLWRRRLQAKDLTGSVLINGSWTRPDDGGAA